MVSKGFIRKVEGALPDKKVVDFFRARSKEFQDLTGKEEKYYGRVKERLDDSIVFIKREEKKLAWELQVDLWEAYWDEKVQKFVEVMGRFYRHRIACRNQRRGSSLGSTPTASDRGERGGRGDGRGASRETSERTPREANARGSTQPSTVASRCFENIPAAAAAAAAAAAGDPRGLNRQRPPQQQERERKRGSPRR
uniref:Uncharacterized protein n=1 Tax=Chromera velia CCMP2878 TaxID=1169474 RepID=A0A0G4FK02_9ALVE|eukprot:Cvel_3418.t1-p1 / transcript=Cvel_3418.t1 / gene=Cvel_3418 / organism=Chromera_velia_CCMP2878 / gene_product=hypothetical protein / transcript_product=hypothetical protein / location=Cvel_scaffold137:77375-80398(+) / protein_length=195 / sequence_SO=supercontig / SO=protein_coding / is_pseudo=false